VATTLPLEVFTQRNFIPDFFRQKLNLLAKTAKSRFVPSFGRLRGNAHSSTMAHWEAVRKQLNICTFRTFKMA